jgi:hypothetical protein
VHSFAPVVDVTLSPHSAITTPGWGDLSMKPDTWCPCLSTLILYVGSQNGNFLPMVASGGGFAKAHDSMDTIEGKSRGA